MDAIIKLSKLYSLENEDELKKEIANIKTGMYLMNVAVDNIKIENDKGARYGGISNFVICPNGAPLFELSGWGLNIKEVYMPRSAKDILIDPGYHINNMYMQPLNRIQERQISISAQSKCIDKLHVPVNGVLNIEYDTLDLSLFDCIKQIKIYSDVTSIVNIIGSNNGPNKVISGRNVYVINGISRLEVADLLKYGGAESVLDRLCEIGNIDKIERIWIMHGKLREDGVVIARVSIGNANRGRAIGLPLNIKENVALFNFLYKAYKDLYTPIRKQRE